MSNSNTRILLIAAGLGLLAYYGYDQLSKLSQSVIQIQGIRNFFVSGSSITVQPEISIYNPSDVNIKVRDLMVKAYTRLGAQWVLTGQNGVPVNDEIGARDVSTIAPVIVFPLSAIGVQLLTSSLFKQPLPTDEIKLEITATVAGQSVNYSQIIDTRDYL